MPPKVFIKAKLQHRSELSSSFSASSI